ncbi:MAG: pyrroloquinoline quinone-dependent dehydrogenase [Halioglobus sp.]
MFACEGEFESPRYASAERTDTPTSHEWRSYLGDKGFSHYSALDQITTQNVAQLQEVWRYRARGAAEDGSTQMQCSPLVVKGILYCTSPTLHAFALEASTGIELWRFDPVSNDNKFLPNPNRGVAYWERSGAKPVAANNSAEQPSQRILYTAGSFLYALDARTGKPIRAFGNNGKVDLHQGLPEHFQGAAVIATTPGSIYKNLLIIGSRVSEFAGAAPGHIRAFDVITGELRWVFQTIPSPGQPGAETWPAGALHNAGGANSWAGIAIDESRGMAFVPTGSPSFDFFGNDRHGDNLFANTLLALDANTGERIWHYQFVHHDLWDRDLPSPPNLITIERNGEYIPAVAQATKTGHLFIFNRETGEPLVPIEDVPVHGEPVPGEQPASFQPVPLAPPPFAEQHFRPTDRSPAMTAAVQQRIANLDYGQLYMTPSTRGAVLYPGMDGGAEWGGAAYDAGEQRLYINSNEVPYLLQLTPVPADMGLTPKFGYLMLCAGCHGGDLRGDGVSVPGLRNLGERLSVLKAYQVVREGRARMPAFDQAAWYEIAAVLWHIYTFDEDDTLLAPEASTSQSLVADGTSYLNAGFQKLIDPEGLPASKPPWGSLTAIDLKAMDILWRIPFGDYPQVLAAGQSGLGAENYGGPVVTSGDLLFIAATPDQMIRAYNKHTGALLWQAQLPAAGFATPVTYKVDGRQFLVIAAGGGKLGRDSGDYYVAFALPENTATPAQ